MCVKKMEFLFNGYENLEGKNNITIRFNFLKYSDYINSLEPEEGVPVLVPEYFSKENIEGIKEILEMIEDNNYDFDKLFKMMEDENHKFVDDIKYVCSCKTRIFLENIGVFGKRNPLIDFFNFNGVIKQIFESEFNLFLEIKLLRFDMKLEEKDEMNRIIKYNCIDMIDRYNFMKKIHKFSKGDFDEETIWPFKYFIKISYVSSEINELERIRMKITNNQSNIYRYAIRL